VIRTSKLIEAATLPPVRRVLQIAAAAPVVVPDPSLPLFAEAASHACPIEGADKQFLAPVRQRSGKNLDCLFKENMKQSKSKEDKAHQPEHEDLDLSKYLQNSFPVNDIHL
jgi:hypothetical protein